MNDVSHLTAGQLAGYVDRDLEQAERHKVESHLDLCADCRSELVELMRMATSPDDTHAATRGRRLMRHWWLPVAMAAGLAGLLLLPRTTEPPAPASAPLERPASAGSESMPRVEVVAPADGSEIPAREVVFVWHARAADTYRLTLLTESGEPVWTHETSDTSAALPPTVALLAGNFYFWRVDAVADGISATTGVYRLRITQ